jgi:hypothetical protein
LGVRFNLKTNDKHFIKLGVYTSLMNGNKEKREFEIYP